MPSIRFVLIGLNAFGSDRGKKNTATNKKFSEETIGSSNFADLRPRIASWRDILVNQLIVNAAAAAINNSRFVDRLHALIGHHRGNTVQEDAALNSKTRASLMPLGISTRRSLILGAIGMVSLGAGGAALEKIWRAKDMTARLFNPFSIEKFELPSVPGLLDPHGSPIPGFSARDLAQKRSILNVWASWCPTCRAEHNALMSLAKRNLAPIYGATVKDSPEHTKYFLARHGNPYVAVGADDKSYLMRALGAHGVPATFVVGPGPRIEWSTFEPLNEETIERQIVPLFNRLG